MHVAVILPRWIGDAVMATPLLRSIRSHYGTQARITGVMRPAVAELLADTPWLDAPLLYDRHGRNPAHSFTAAMRRLRADRPDLALVLPASLSTAAFAFCSGARRRVGHAGNFRRFLLTDLVPTHGRDPIVPPPVAYMEIAAAVGAPATNLEVELFVSAADRARGDALLAELFPGRAGPLIVLNDNSSNGPARSWGVDNHAALARRLVDRVPGCRVLMHCGPGDRPPARAFVEQAGHPAVRGLGDVPELPLGLSKAIYSRAAAAVSSDSGPRHIAAAFRVPTVALLGPTDSRLGRSDPSRCVEIRRSLACAPCGEARCPLRHNDCMRLITIDEVAAAVFGLLERAPRL